MLVRSRGDLYEISGQAVHGPVSGFGNVPVITGPEFVKPQLCIQEELVTVDGLALCSRRNWWRIGIILSEEVRLGFSSERVNRI